MSARKSRPSASSRGKSSVFRGILIGSVLFSIVSLSLTAWVLFGGGSDDPTEENRDRPDARVIPLAGGAGLREDGEPVGTIRVRTDVPGFFVIVDGDPALDPNGQFLRTPCEITTPQGDIEVRVVNDGYQEQSRIVSLRGRVEELDFESTRTADGSTPGVLSTPWFLLPVGEPVSLGTLNSPARELDPCLSRDGLTIAFVSERNGREGVYVADRSTIYEPFGPPRLLPLSQGSETPAAPSLFADAMISYTQPNGARVQSLPDDPTAPPSEKVLLRASDKPSDLWLSSQVLPHGRALYWTSREDQKTRVSVRDELKRDFSGVREIELPGFHPCLSADGLRQYVFDGTKLTRYTRTATNVGFGVTPEPVATLTLPGYQNDFSRRQYFVSDDESWMVYANDPRGDSDLYLVRLAIGRGWGQPPRGVTIEPEAPQVVTNDPGDEPETETDPMPILGETDNEPDPEPEPIAQGPLPYSVFRDQFLTLMREGKPGEARDLAAQALADPIYDGDREPLTWDREDAETVLKFWEFVQTTFAKLPNGEKIPRRLSEVRFSRFDREKNAVVGTMDGKSVEVSLEEFTPSELLQVLDRHVEKTDGPSQYLIGNWLFYRPKLFQNQTGARMRAAGDAGQDFRERLAGRLLHRAERELDRGSPPKALAWVERLTDSYPNSDAAGKIPELLETVYASTRWQPVGRRWTTNTPGEYYALGIRQEGAFLRSPEKFSRFELRLEYRVDEALDYGGIFFHYPGEDDPAVNAFRIHLGGRVGPPADIYTTGSLFKRVAPRENAARKAGSWNTCRLVVDGLEVTCEINGKQVLKTTALDPEIDAGGYVLLDGRNGGVRYRKTLLVALPPKPGEDSDGPEEPETEEPILLLDEDMDPEE